MKFTPPDLTHLQLAVDGRTARARVILGSHERTPDHARAVALEVMLELAITPDESVEHVRDRATKNAMKFLNVEVAAEPPQPSTEEWVRDRLK